MDLEVAFLALNVEACFFGGHCKDIVSTTLDFMLVFDTLVDISEHLYLLIDVYQVLLLGSLGLEVLLLAGAGD